MAGAYPSTPGQRKRRPIKAATITSLAQASDSLARVSLPSGGAQQTVDGVPILGGGRRLPSVLFATNPGTSFAANTTRDLDLYNGQGVTVQTSVTIRNPSWSSAYAASARLIVAWDGNEYIVIGRWC